MLGIVDLDFRRSDSFQDVLDRYGLASFVVNATGDASSRSLISAADILIVQTDLLPAVLAIRRETRRELKSTDDSDIAVPFSVSPGAPYHVVMRHSLTEVRPDWRMFRAPFGHECQASNLVEPPRFLEPAHAG